MKQKTVWHIELSRKFKNQAKSVGKNKKVCTAKVIYNISLKRTPKQDG